MFTKRLKDLKKDLFSWLLWLVIHLRSILGVKNKMMVLLNWLWNKNCCFHHIYNHGILVSEQSAYEDFLFQKKGKEKIQQAIPLKV